MTVDVTIEKFKIQWTVLGTGMIMKDFTSDPLWKRIGHRDGFFPLWVPGSLILDTLVDVIMDLIIYGTDGPQCKEG